MFVFSYQLIQMISKNNYFHHEMCFIHFCLDVQIWFCSIELSHLGSHCMEYWWIRAFGYSSEDVQMVIETMASQGKEPTFCMGDDIPLAVLSQRPHMLYDYFKQRFAQVCWNYIILNEILVDVIILGLVLSGIIWVLFDFTGCLISAFFELLPVIPYMTFFSCFDFCTHYSLI